MSIARLKHARALRTVASVMLVMATLQGCASGAARPEGPLPSPGAGASRGEAACANAEYQDLVRKSQEQPLTDQERARMQELHARCLAAAQAQSQPAGEKTGGGLLRKVLLVWLVLGAAALLLAGQLEEVEDEDMFMGPPIGLTQPVPAPRAEPGPANFAA